MGELSDPLGLGRNSADSAAGLLRCFFLLRHLILDYLRNFAVPS